MFPFGSDFTPDEMALLPALQRLQGVSVSKLGLAAFLLSSLGMDKATPTEEALLRRLELDRPRSLGERMLKRLVLRALRD